MGFIKEWVAKATGADVQADIAERSAAAQAASVREAAERSAKATQEAAAQTARVQEQAAARAAAEAKAADVLAKPVENVDVQLGGVPTESASASARRRRATFGVGVRSSGVNI